MKRNHKQGGHMDKQRMADVLMSAWVLGTADKSDRARRLPTAQGILDRALKSAIAEGHFSTEDFQHLRFVETRLGTRCPDLRAILSWAQAADQTTDPNPSYNTTEPKFSPRVARRMLLDLEIDPERAKGWGRALLSALAKERGASSYRA